MKAIEVTISSLHSPRPDDAAVGERDALDVQVVDGEGIEGSLRDELYNKTGEESAESWNALQSAVENSSGAATQIETITEDNCVDQLDTLVLAAVT